MADRQEARAPATGSPVQVLTVVCLPGGGGPALADELRVMCAHGDVAVRAIVVAPGELPAPPLVGDPISGVFWPCAATDAPGDVLLEEAGRSARRLRWFLWEMGIDARCEVRSGDPLQVTVGAGLDPGTDVVVLAAPACRRWRTVARGARVRLAGCGVELREALDRRSRRLDSLLPALGLDPL